MKKSSNSIVMAALKLGHPISVIIGNQIQWQGDEPTGAQVDEIMLEAARLEVSQIVLSQMGQIGSALVAKYPRTEQQGWPEKIVEARAVDAGDMAEGDAYMLGIEAAITGETVAALATATLAAAQLTAMIPAVTAGLRRRLSVAIEAATTEAELDDLLEETEAARIAITDAFATGDPVAVQAALAAI